MDLFGYMLSGAVVIWCVVVGTAFYAIRLKRRPLRDKAAIHLIVWGGCVLPTVVLAALLFWGLSLMPDLRRPADGPTIAVSGERFWWRVAYDVEGEPGVVRNLPEGGVASANEIWLPLGKRSEILLGSPDVIHSLWVPAIAGKMDAIPGRVTRLVLHPTREGVYQGACAEFCGSAHAQMGLRVIVIPEARYDAYVEAQRAPAAVTRGPGVDRFIASGCGSCHSVRGTEANGNVGPDLTHIAGRRTLFAGLKPMTVDNIAAFIEAPGHVKPGVEMPEFGMLSRGDIRLIAEWLGSLE